MLDWDAVDAFRRRSLNPEHPVLRGSAQNPDIFFQAREACNPYYDDAVEATVHYMDEVNSRLGTDYKPSTIMRAGCGECCGCNGLRLRYH